MDCRSSERIVDEALPLFRFTGAFRRLLGAYKFRDRRSLAPYLAELVAVQASARWPLWPIAPVPPRPGKLRERGWDQVEDLASCLERRGFELIRPLERMSSTQQKRLGRLDRGSNARASYRLKRGALVPARVLLIDDVVTTGATAEACAAALKAGGAARVAFIALAAD